MILLNWPHIEIRPAGVPVVAGTATKVVEIVLDRLAHHWDVDEMRRQHPHLTAAHLYSALAYYHEHEEEMNRMIEERLRREDELLSGFDDSALRARLLAARASR